jgi:hypothetical protein
VVLIHPQAGLNEFGGIRQIYPSSCKKSFRILLPGWPIGCVCVLEVAASRMERSAGFAEGGAGGRDHAVLPGNRAIGVIVRIPHSSTFGNQVLKRYLPNF